MKPVKKLNDLVAKKIAAGEVIDRPYSVVRELLDNSIDAGSSDISIYVENGGVTNIRVVDNGSGMSREDLSLCYLPHATSKIETEDDLLSLKSLGFRGEALSSISTCTKLSIVSKKQGEEAYKLIVHGGEFLSLNEFRGSVGSIINASDLFYSIPARRKFLKKASAETTLCKNTFLEKAIPFPNINFKFYKDDKLELFLPKSTLKERVINSFKNKFNSSLLEEVSCEGEGFKIQAVLGRPELHRKDRKYMHVYTNKRRITEFAFIQALQYGYNEVLPGGNYPIAFIFIDVDPSLIDFNIHPAKKEAKFNNLQTIHHRLVELVKSFLSQYHYNMLTSHKSSAPIVKELIDSKRDYNYTKNIPVKNDVVYKEKFDSFLENPPTFKSHQELRDEVTNNNNSRSYKYLGQIMDVFLLVERDNTLYVIDQHATHERILYNKLTSQKVNSQDLLLPIEFEVTNEDINLIEKNLDTYLELGIKVAKLDDDTYKITALPSFCKLLDSEIIDFIKSKKGAKADIQRDLYDTLACRSAIKEGDPIDPVAARELIDAAFQLDQARCPHGRPIWFELTKKELYELVGRI
ncbi:DNA mismatch repair endonuclease MutL [Thiospirochaeta perfilievii]|uniref:DNA mismatch repair protein MutL n=1 Tax=Thiospirochaeta perfilievii TaxID=252967 RepID=A0A5C1QAY7_9SPIO|nr:DNA mismatch repair endonuclease MutL [Thiospirochaeta perfilievii]QEN03824.1 DNA mismatch repair endonuclease MutL [Thiospirochaeta perfilievii]